VILLIFRPEEKIKQLEEKIYQLIEDSAVAGFRGDHKKALQLAKDASSKEKSLMKLKEQAGTNEGHDWDLTFSVKPRHNAIHR
jgi:intraflagellar transport protein 88